MITGTPGRSNPSPSEPTLARLLPVAASVLECSPGVHAPPRATVMRAAPDGTRPDTPASASRVSVVIPARNAAAELGECLAAVASQGVADEVLVVDDGSTDDTAAVAATHGARVLAATGRGPAAARNLGARAACGEIVVFLDADCVPLAGCLRALVAPFADPGVAGVRGAYASTQRALVARFVQLEMEEKQARLARSRQVALVDTACAAYRRTVFLDEGGFDERFPATSAEDAELSFRLVARGARLVYAPGARVRHTHPERLDVYAWRKLRFGFYRARLYRRHPARLREDGYTPRVMPLQIALAGLLCASLAAAAWLPASLPAAGGLALAFLASSLPMARRAWAQDRRLALLVPCLLLARSLAQGVGLAAGLAAIAAEGVAGRWPRRGLARSNPDERAARRCGAATLARAALPWASTLLSLVALAVVVQALAQTSWDDLAGALSGARLGWLGAAVGLVLAAEALKAARWWLLLGARAERLPALVGLLLASRLLNALTPFRAGDVWRVAGAAGGERAPLVTATGSVLAEKVLDGLGLAALGALLWPPGPGQRAALLVLGATLAAALAAVWLLRARLRPWLSPLGFWRDGRILAGALLLSLGGLGLGLLANLAVLHALGQPELVRRGVIMLLAGFAAGLVPAAPGRVGVFEVGVAAPLMLDGVPPAAALAAALALHLVLLVSLVLGGAVAVPLGLARRSPAAHPSGRTASELGR